MNGVPAPLHEHHADDGAAETKGRAPRKADQHIAVGETFDFEELRLEGWSPGDNRRAVQTLIFEDR